MNDFFMKIFIISIMILVPAIAPIFAPSMLEAVTAWTYYLILFLRIIIYSGIFYMCSYIGGYKERFGHMDSIVGATILAVASIIPLPYPANYVIFLGMLFVIFKIIFNSDWRTAITFISILFAVNILLSVGGYKLLEQRYDDTFYPRGFWGICRETPGGSMVPGSIEVDGKTYMDFCSTSFKLSNASKVVSCKGENCYLVKYTCEKDYIQYATCKWGCRGGACDFDPEAAAKEFIDEIFNK